MLKFWLRIRIAMLLIVFVGLGFYLFATTPWGRLFGRLPDYHEITQAGQPIVEAIYRFHAQTNLWPEYVDDISPKYLKERPPADWYYTANTDGISLAKATGEPHTYVGFDFDPATPTWRVFGDKDNRILATLSGSATTHPAAPDKDELLANQLTELDRRIAREKTNLDHPRAKFSLLQSLHRTAEALQLLDQTQATNPTSYWPRLTRALLLHTDEERQSFAQWTNINPSFTHYCYLAQLYQSANKTPDAQHAIESALAQPLELASDDPDTLPTYFWNLALLTTEQKNFPLQLKIADAWEKSQLNLRHPEYSYLAFRAAAQLAQKNPTAALQSLSALTATNSSPWAQNLPALRTAIQQNNSTFQYSPGPSRGSSNPITPQ